MTGRTEGEPPGAPPVPCLGALDLHLFGEGRHHRLWQVLGAHMGTKDGVAGVAFSTWAPRARSVSVVGSHNGWRPDGDPLTPVGGSGVWSGFVPGIGVGALYKFSIVGPDGSVQLHADPMARAAECPPGTASIVEQSTYRWLDEHWRRSRAGASPESRLSIYELHLGSWRQGAGYGSADELAEYVTALGFTHVELLPLGEHPFGGSWGYQVTGYYAPTARYGTPDELRAFVDALHRRGIGVIVDWVPAHFPADAWGLATYDGTACFEPHDDRVAWHPDWGTKVFDLDRPEVRNFLLANALYWIEEFHVDGLRVDAVASLLYLDYSRAPGDWTPNVHGGHEDLAAVAFLRELTSTVSDLHPGVALIAEESTAWPRVTGPVDDGGLGFTHKWNLGWMHDTLRFLARPPRERGSSHGDVTFGLTYAWSERFVLPLSHDEVVHGKGSLIAKMPGDRWQRFATLRCLYAWMWAHPGQQLLFMGGELAQEREWDHDRPLDWELLDDRAHRGVQHLVGELNRLQAAERALWAADATPDGFRWIAADDVSHAVLCFERRAPGARPVVCLASFTASVHDDYRIGVPVAGTWEVLLSTDDQRFGGSGVCPVDSGVELRTDATAFHGHAQSLALRLPPLAVVWLAPRPR